MSNLEEGHVEGENCNREYGNLGICEGIIKEHERENCSCHINPPCSYCIEDQGYCEFCKWDSHDE